MLNDDDFVSGFEAGTLEQFHHSDHVRLTILYLERYDRDQALRRLSAGLIRFATSKGHPEKFHVTLTRAWLDLIESARAAHPGARAADLVRACPQLLDKDALTPFYSREVLASERARIGWVPPDRTPLIACRHTAVHPADGSDGRN
jgi:hypothetical protein